MLRLKVSGSFKTKPGTDEDRHPFADVEVIIPKVEEAYYNQCIIRLFQIALNNDKRFSKVNYEGLIKIYIDSVTPDSDLDNPCEGKDIKEMSWEELQYYAATACIREIPLYHIGDIRTAREKAYEMYMKIFKKKKVIKSALDKKIITERIQSSSEKLGLDADETEAKIKEALADAFDMSVDPNNIERSYNFSKLPALIPIPSMKKVDKK